MLQELAKRRLAVEEEVAHGTLRWFVPAACLGPRATQSDDVVIPAPASGRGARDQTPWAGRRRPSRFTVAHRKQSTTWSLTMPTDCMNA